MTTPAYKVTGQHVGRGQLADGSAGEVVSVSYQTTTTPAATGSVTIPVSALSDPAGAASAVDGAIKARIAAHAAIAGLGNS